MSTFCLIYSDIPTRIGKENVDIFAGFLCKSINATFKSPMFPNSLELAEHSLTKKRQKRFKRKL